MWEFDKDKFKDFWKSVWQLSLKKDLFFNASAITFNLFLCALPFSLILISILGYVLSIDAAFEELVRYGRELFPQFEYETNGDDVIVGAITIESFIKPLIGARQIFGIVGLIILMVFAQGLFHTLKHVLFDVFDIEDRKHPAMELVYNFFAFGVVGGVFVFFSMAISLISLFAFEAYSIPYTDVTIELGWVYDWLTSIVPLIFTFFLFFAIYRFISERRMTPRVALVAAIVYTVLFELAKIGASLYLEYTFSAYRYFYQGYSTLIVIGIWAFYSALLFIIASIMARAYQDVYLADAPSIEKNPYTAIS